MADWYNLGEINYRKWPVYEQMSWENIQIDKHQVFGAQYGGPLALMKTNDEMSPDQPRVGEKDKIKIYSASGKFIGEIEIDNKSNVVGVGWSDQEHLILVYNNGNVLLFDIFGKLIKSIQMTDPNDRCFLLECRFWGDGFVAMASDNQIYVLDGIASHEFSSIRSYSMPTELHSKRAYTTLEAIPPLLSRSGMLEVLVATSDCSILIVDESQCKDQYLQDKLPAPITSIAIAPNGRFLACHRCDGILTVLSSNFTTKVLDFDTKSVSKPVQLEWCGEDSVALLWKNTGIIMVGPYGDWMNFPYEVAIHIIAEPDCLRILSSASCEFIQRVNPALEAIKKIGSTDPAALLFDAMEAFEEGDPKSDENIRSIAAANQLENATKSCITAATSEFDVSRQQSLLKAASYGKSFCSNMDPSFFVDTVRKLRVLNNVRNVDIGIPLTFQQFNRLTLEILISRLIKRNHHLLALKICELLKLKFDRVLVHWACEKVKKLANTPASDEEITLAISRRLSGRGKVSYLDIASSAYYMGRRRLATMILDMEQNPSDQIPLLLSMKEDELALQKAINSGDSDLIYVTLFQLEKSRDFDSFFRLVHSHTEAVNLLKSYYKLKVVPSDSSLYHSLLMFERCYMEAGTTSWLEAYNQDNLSRRINLLKEASSIFTQGKDTIFYKSVIDEQIDLLETQKALQIRSNSKFLGLTIAETLKKIYQLAFEFPSETSRWEQEAVKLIKKFKMSDKLVCLLRIDSYAEMAEWGALFRYSNEKKPPTGYRPFALVCIKYNQPVSEVEKYIDRMESKEERYDLYIDLQIWPKATDMAFKLKDHMRLHEVARLARDPNLEKHIQDLLGKI